MAGGTKTPEDSADASVQERVKAELQDVQDACRKLVKDVVRRVDPSALEALADLFQAFMRQLGRLYGACWDNAAISVSPGDNGGELLRSRKGAVEKVLKDLCVPRDVREGALAVHEGTRDQKGSAKSTNFKYRFLMYDAGWDSMREERNLTDMTVTFFWATQKLLSIELQRIVEQHAATTDPLNVLSEPVTFLTVLQLKCSSPWFAFCMLSSPVVYLGLSAGAQSKGKARKAPAAAQKPVAADAGGEAATEEGRVLVGASSSIAAASAAAGLGVAEAYDPSDVVSDGGAPRPRNAVPVKKGGAALAVPSDKSKAEGGPNKSGKTQDRSDTRKSAIVDGSKGAQRHKSSAAVSAKRHGASRSVSRSVSTSRSVSRSRSRSRGRSHSRSRSRSRSPSRSRSRSRSVESDDDESDDDDGGAPASGYVVAEASESSSEGGDSDSDDSTSASSAIGSDTSEESVPSKKGVRSSELDAVAQKGGEVAAAAGKSRGRGYDRDRDHRSRGRSPSSSSVSSSSSTASSASDSDGSSGSESVDRHSRRHDKGRASDRGRDRERQRDHGGRRSQERGRERERSRGHARGRDQHRSDRGRGYGGDRDRDYERRTDRNRDYERDRSSDRHRHREGDSSKHNKSKHASSSKRGRGEDDNTNSKRARRRQDE